MLGHDRRELIAELRQLEQEIPRTEANVSAKARLARELLAIESGATIGCDDCADFWSNWHEVC